MKLRIVTNKETHNLKYVKAYYFEKMFLSVLHEKGNKRYYKLSTIIDIFAEQ